MTDQNCSACGGTEHLRHSPFHGSYPICSPCFMVWYDPPGTKPIDRTKSTEVGAFSLEMKVAGKWPWTGEYAPSEQR